MTQRCVSERLSLSEHCNPSLGGLDCPDSARPLCSNGFCLACSSLPAAQADAACKEFGSAAGQPFVACLRDGAQKGQCAECRLPAGSENSAAAVPCTHVERPICDGATCRGCQKHSECEESGICNDGSGVVTLDGVAVGQCVPKDKVFLIDAAHCPPGGLGAEGTRERPFCDFDGAISAAAGRDAYLVVRPKAAVGEVYGPLVLTGGHRTVVVGSGREGGKLLGSVAVTGAGTALSLVDIAVDSQTSGSAILCGSGASLSLIRTAVDLNGQAAVGVDATGCERLELLASTVTHSHGPAVRIGTGTKTYGIVNSIFTDNASDGTSAVTFAAGTSGTFSFNTLINNGILSGTGMGRDGGAVTCETGSRPLLANSLILQNGTSGRTDPGGKPLGTQFSGTCRLSHLVVGADALSALGPDQAAAAIPDLDGKLRLIDTPNNAACCIDKVSPCDDVKSDYFSNRRPQGKGCDLGAHELH